MIDKIVEIQLVINAVKKELILEFVIIMKKACELTDDFFIHNYLFKEIEKWEDKLK